MPNDSRDELALAKTVLSMPTVAIDGAKAGAPIGRESRLSGLCRAVDRRLAGKRGRCLAVLILGLGLAGPFLDWLRSEQRPIWTVLFTNVWLLALWVLFFAWSGSLRTEDGTWRAGLLVGRFGSLVQGWWEACVELRTSEPRLRRAVIGGTLIIVACLAISAYGLWILAVTILDQPGSGIFARTLLFGVALGCTILGLATAGPALFRRKYVTDEQSRLALYHFGQLPAVLDLSVVTEPRDGVSGSVSPFGSDPLEVTLSALARWKERRWQRYSDEHGYRKALFRHLRVHAGLLDCRCDVWCGRADDAIAADLVVGGLLIIQVKRGFLPSTAARALEEMRALDLHLPGKPKLLVVFDAERGQILKSDAIGELQRLRESATTITIKM